MTPSRVKEIFRLSSEANSAIFMFGKDSDAAQYLLSESATASFVFFDSAGMQVKEDNQSFECSFYLNFLKHDRPDSAPSNETEQSAYDSRESIMFDMYDLWKTIKSYIITNYSNEVNIFAKDDGAFIQHGWDVCSGYSLRVTVMGGAECL